jgi:AraC-like DNA-binding protein
MTDEQVRMWRPADEERVLLMSGRTTRYAMDPRGEYVFGVITHRPMRSRRGPERRLTLPGQLLAWDPSSAHAGSAVDGKPWSARLMVVEIADLATLTVDGERSMPADVAFPEPVLSDTKLAHAFLRMHTAMETASTRLERDEQLTEWLRAAIEHSSAGRTTRSRLAPRDRQALIRASDYLGEAPERNVSLDELATVAGIGKFRLIRLFRERTGLPPHALQIAHRVRRARRLLEAGETIAATAAATGFADQSHLHRHFRRGLGLTPAEYQRRFTA